MNIHQLELKLKSENFPVHAYSLNGGYPNEAFCIGQNNGKWEVYYSERGNKSSLKIFDTEEEACVCLYNWLVSVIKK